ncbi:hypothetical protein K501DRAFT_298979 [Backusella circina FSU 941]|nr:hypothetical protein K501DRAFT_298979 [Backusella circina FSU 941]
MESINIWLNTKLEPNRYTIYGDNPQDICFHVSVIMYTIVIHDDDIERDFPVTFMFSNDQTIGVITQWLSFLITIDSHTELNAISTTFPACKIQYCLFHVSQAWGQGGMMIHLKVLLYEEDPDNFNELIDNFKTRFAAQDVFMEYFERSWCREEKFDIWSRAYHFLEFSYMLTSNYIESWHNQLKSVYLKRTRNKRLDRLFFILTVEIDYDINEEYHKVRENNGTMSSAERRRRAIELTAERRRVMIADPLGDVGNYTSTPGDWFIESYMVEDISYSVHINEHFNIVSCTCYDFRKRRKACKHMHLLKIHILSFNLVTLPIVSRFRYSPLLCFSRK